MKTRQDEIVTIKQQQIDVIKQQNIHSIIKGLSRLAFWPSASPCSPGLQALARVGPVCPYAVLASSHALLCGVLADRWANASPS